MFYTVYVANAGRAVTAPSAFRLPDTAPINNLCCSHGWNSGCCSGWNSGCCFWAVLGTVLRIILRIVLRTVLIVVLAVVLVVLAVISAVFSLLFAIINDLLKKCFISAVRYVFYPDYLNRICLTAGFIGYKTIMSVFVFIIPLIFYLSLHFMSNYNIISIAKDFEISDF